MNDYTVEKNYIRKIHRKYIIYVFYGRWDQPFSLHMPKLISSKLMFQPTSPSFNWKYPTCKSHR